VAEEQAEPLAVVSATPLVVFRGQPRRIGLSQRALAYLASGFSALFGPRGEEGFGILMYHRVVDPPRGYPRPTWNVPPERFERQLVGLLRRGWEPYTLRSVLERHELGMPIPRKVFVVTFDDGYENNLLYALPVLQKLGIPATIFLATAYLDSNQPFPSDDWQAAGEAGVPADTWRPLTTDQCHELLASGLIELGAHTHTHADFRGRPVELAADLQTCSYELRERFGIERPTFALPYGTKTDGFASAALSAAARQAGVLCSLTTEPQLVGKDDDPFDWGRFAAEEHDTAATLVGKLGGWHRLLRSLARKALGK
jgi:peptidoglycan/xylan/chitin deacetylase (PgdA/CDA1 family)